MVHGKPLFRNLTVDVLVADRSLLQAGAERLSALMGNVVLHGFIDEPASLAWSGQTVNGLDRGLWKHDVETSAHGN